MRRSGARTSTRRPSRTCARGCGSAGRAPVGDVTGGQPGVAARLLVGGLVAPVRRHAPAPSPPQPASWPSQRRRSPAASSSQASDAAREGQGRRVLNDSPRSSCAASSGRWVQEASTNHGSPPSDGRREALGAPPFSDGLEGPRRPAARCIDRRGA